MKLKRIIGTVVFLLTMSAAGTREAEAGCHGVKAVSSPVYYYQQPAQTYYYQQPVQTYYYPCTYSPYVSYNYGYNGGVIAWPPLTSSRTSVPVNGSVGTSDAQRIADLEGRVLLLEQGR